MADAELRRDPSTMAIRSRGWLLLALVVLGACQADRTTGARPGAGGALAKGSGGGTTGSTAPSVSATSPSQAPQDTTLDVTVSGSGFTTGARATWALNGDTTLVHVKATKVVSSTQLVATIVVPAGAPVASYDVQVMLVDGKKGVGVELFAVLLGDPAASFLFPLDDATLGVRSDHASTYTSGANSVYANGVCGVVARIFATASASNSGDATMQTDNPRTADRKCRDYPRKLTIDYGDGVVQSSTVFVNARDLQNTDPASVIPQGTTVQRRLTLQEGRCGSLRWAPVLADGTVSGADFVNVTRIDASTWLVATQPYPNDKTYCNVDGRLRHIQARFQIVASRPLPM